MAAQPWSGGLAEQRNYSPNVLRILIERKFMINQNRFSVFLLGAATLALLGAGVARAADSLDAETKARVERFEKGALTIDVSKYPGGIRDNYEVFSTKCTQCHKLSLSLIHISEPTRRT